MRWLWIENSNGRKDVMLTFSLAAFTVVLLKVIFGGMTLTISGQEYEVLPIDPATIGALLTPTLGAYVFRRYTDRKFIDANSNGIDDRIEAANDANQAASSVYYDRSYGRAPPWDGVRFVPPASVRVDSGTIAREFGPRVPDDRDPTGGL